MTHRSLLSLPDPRKHHRFIAKDTFTPLTLRPLVPEKVFLESSVSTRADPLLPSNAVRPSHRRLVPITHDPRLFHTRPS